MTSKDKTGDQLVASIRKSKTGAVAKKTRARSTTRSTAARPPAARSTTKPETGAPAADGYRHGRRVWPD